MRYQQYTPTQPTILSWQFRAEGGDVAFGVVRVWGDKEEVGKKRKMAERIFLFAPQEQLVTVARVPAHRELQAGDLFITAGATVIVTTSKIIYWQRL